MKRMSPRPIFIHVKIPLKVPLGKMTDPNRQYSSQVFTSEKSIHVLFLSANFSLNFNFPVSASVFLIFICVLKSRHVSSFIPIESVHPKSGNC